MTISWIFVTVVLLSLPLLVGEILLILPGLSTSTTVLIVLALPPAVSLYFLVLAYRQKFPLGKAATKVLCVYALLIALAGGYAWFLYPYLPQSLGGGRPEKVTLYIKPGELPALLGMAGTANERVSESFPAYIYYRTSTYLLISKDQNADQPLVQIPLDLVRAIAWIDSSSKLEGF